MLTPGAPAFPQSLAAPKALRAGNFLLPPQPSQPRLALRLPEHFSFETEEDFPVAPALAQQLQREQLREIRKERERRRKERREGERERAREKRNQPQPGNRGFPGQWRDEGGKARGAPARGGAPAWGGP